MNIIKAFVVASAAFFIAPASAQNAGTVSNHAIPIGKGAGVQGFGSLALTSGQIVVGQTSADPLAKTLSGDATLSAAGALTLATVNSNVGSFGSTTQCATVTVNAKGLITAASAATCAPAVGSITGLGTGIATFLATPSSANLRSALTDEVGTGAAYFVGGALGTPASGTATNLTGVTLSGHASQAAYTFVGNNSGSSAAPTAVDIAGLTTKASPAASDYAIISDQAASGAWKKATISSIASAGSVSSIAGNTGAFTLANGIDNSTNQIQLTAARRTLPTTQSLTSGSSATYTTPANCLWIEVFMVGGGGGGAGAPNSGSTIVAGSAGGTSTFNSVNAVGGGGAGIAGIAGVGGTGGTGTATRRARGGVGQSVSNVVSASLNSAVSGGGGDSYFGGSALGVVGQNNGNAGATNSGGGGAGASNNAGANFNIGGGGGAGEFVYLLINSPSGSYTYTIGGGGAGGSATNTGGAGGSGFIFVIEHYGS